MVKQLNKLINVVKITELDSRDSIQRELCIVTVSVDRDRRNEVLELAQIFEARILAVGHTSMVVSLEGEPDKIDDFEELVRPFGIIEMQRTGRIALAKLERGTSRIRPIDKAKAS
jgi:acetolactate synthase-1/3 small subunit